MDNNNLESNENYVIEIEDVVIEVDELFFKAYKRLDRRSRYLDEKYYKMLDIVDFDTVVILQNEHFLLANFSCFESRVVSEDYVNDFIKHLDKIDQKIVLGLLDGYSEAEIANQMNINQSSVHKRRQKLKKILQEELKEEKS